MNTRLITALIAASIVVVSHAANAGGLFGDGGLIGGDVGRFMQKNVQEPVLTPLVRGAVVGTTTAVGGVVGGALGGPTGATVGGLGGKYVGDEINRYAAGEGNPIGRPAQYPPQQYSAPVLGNRCATPVGIFAPGPWDQVGAPCHGNGPYGPIPGQVIQ
jgi:hypothetical protein